MIGAKENAVISYFLCVLLKIFDHHVKKSHYLLLWLMVRCLWQQWVPQLLQLLVSQG